ncbi:hypothetical protein GQ457_17G008910 [Hibiscus cannabinus]
MGVIALYRMIKPSVLHLRCGRKGIGLRYLSHSVCLPAIGTADANSALVPRGRTSRATVVTVFDPPSVAARWFLFLSLGFCSSWAGLYGLCFHLPSSPTRNRTAPPPFPFKLKLSYPYNFSGRLANTLHCDFSLLLSTSSCVQHLHPSIYLMAEELLSQLDNLHFTVEEQDVVVVTSDSMEVPAEDFACSLVGKVGTKGSVDRNRLIRDNVLKRRPWEFLKYWFALECTDPTRTIHDYSFNLMKIWIRIHNIPLSLMTVELARSLGACIGRVIMTDTRLEDGSMGEFMRVRVVLDTTKPLRRCVALRRQGGSSMMCPLQYERIPLFCHGCGLLGHPVLNCATTARIEGQKLQYGAWL